MKSSAIILLLSAVFGLVLTIPVDQTNVEPITETTGVNNKDIGDVTRNHICNGNVQEDGTSSSDFSRSSEEQSMQVELSPVEMQPDIVYQPTIQTPATSYQRYTNLPAASPYRNQLYPYARPKYLAAYNAGFQINSLPPVVSTYIHGLIPQEEIQRTSYDLDVLGPQNSAYLPTLARTSRMLRDPEEEWIAQLQHDAIMNNIIPTMQVPFARYAAPAAYAPSEGSYGVNSGVSAVFPSAGSGGCAQPILFSCTPKIIRGYLKPVVPEEAYHSAPAYRQEEHFVSSEKPPVKVNLVEKADVAGVKKGV